MYIHSVKLVNYKSIGDYDEAEVILEPKITAIIGKNESGKSNVLEGLSRIQLLFGNDSAFSPSIVNRNCETGTENYYIIILKANADEITLGATTDTQIIFKKSEYTATGGILQLYGSIVGDSIFNAIEFLDTISNNPFQLSTQEITTYQASRSELLKKDSLNIPKITTALEYMKSKISKLGKTHQEEFERLILGAQKLWFSLIAMIPSIFYRKAD